MNSKHIAVTLSSLVIGIWTLGFAAPKALAQSCTNQYGASVACQPVNLTINKQVKHPTSGLFIENITSSDTPYSPGSEVLYRLVVRNGSGETMHPVTVTDQLPVDLTFVSGPGTYSTPGKPGGTLTFTLNNLIAGQSVTQEVLVKVEPKTPTKCNIVNTGRVTSPARPSGDSDTASICVSTVAPTLPVAGFDDLLLIMPFIGTALGGFAMLRKK
ncbi:DUF11 domain-containing protein [Candidatus Gottesmanbacteria bacterium]|nr:DUF11 domain-containing protein [Candidatus Gottesmanbacteria bacterium]